MLVSILGVQIYRIYLVPWHYQYNFPPGTYIRNSGYPVSVVALSAQAPHPPAPVEIINGGAGGNENTETVWPGLTDPGTNTYYCVLMFPARTADSRVFGVGLLTYM